MEYQNFTASAMHIVSLIFSFIFLFYFLGYELKIYYDMIEYPRIKIRTPAYEMFVKRYAYFLAYYRFEEYNVIIYFNLGSFLELETLL